MAALFEHTDGDGLIDGIIFGQQHAEVFYFSRCSAEFAGISGRDGDYYVTQLPGLCQRLLDQQVNREMKGAAMT
jgi:hypothetical protein